MPAKSLFIGKNKVPLCDLLQLIYGLRLFKQFFYRPLSGKSFLNEKKLKRTREPGHVKAEKRKND